MSHTLATAWRTLEDDYLLTNTNFQRWIAAKADVEANTEAFHHGDVRIDDVLQAQRFLAEAETDYFRSLVNYNNDIMMIHYRKGSLLEYNGVYLAEGPWPGKAYFDARRRARARDAALYLDYGFTQPRVLSGGAVPAVHRAATAGRTGTSERTRATEDLAVHRGVGPTGGGASRGAAGSGAHAHSRTARAGL